jgi:hypothetical protein
MLATRNNDKMWDDLHLRIMISGGPARRGNQRPSLLGRPITLSVSPTVDTAGPSLTSWHSRDTIRVLLPWDQSLSPKWLFFTLQYSSIGPTGKRATCSTSLSSDTLRFGIGH